MSRTSRLYRAQVVPIDKLSVVIMPALAFVFLHEQFAVQVLISSILLTAGALVTVL